MKSGHMKFVNDMLFFMMMKKIQKKSHTSFVYGKIVFTRLKGERGKLNRYTRRAREKVRDDRKKDKENAEWV